MGNAKKNRCYTPGTVNAASVSEKIFLLWLVDQCVHGGMDAYIWLCMNLYVYSYIYMFEKGQSAWTVGQRNRMRFDRGKWRVLCLGEEKLHTLVQVKG